MFACLSSRQFHLMLLLLLAGLLSAACQTVSEQDDAAAIENAKKKPIIFRAIDNAPPRDISDIRTLLKQAQDKPVVPRANEVVKQPPPQTDDNLALARFYWNRGRAAGELGLDQLELEDLRKAALYSKGLNTAEVEEDRILAELGGSETRNGSLLEAVRMQELAVGKQTRYSLGLKINIYRQLAANYARLGQRGKAEQALANAEALLDKGTHLPLYSYFLHNWPVAVAEAKADLLEYEGKYAEAEAYRRQAMSDRKQDIADNEERLKRSIANIAPIIMKRLYARAGRELAENLVKQQRLAEAEAIIRQMIFASLKSNGRYFIGTGANFLSFSDILFQQGRYAEAVETADIALDIFKKLELRPESVNIVRARRTHAAALSAAGRYREALVEFETMRDGLASSPQLQASLGRGDIDWALSLVRTGRGTEAVRMTESLAADLTKRLGKEHYESAEMRGFLALALAQANRREEALKLFAESLPNMVAASATTDGASRSPLRTQHYVELLEAYLDLLVDLRGNPVLQTVGIDPQAESFRIADMARSQGLQRALTSGLARSAATDPALAQLVKQEQEAAQKVSEQQKMLVKLLATPLGDRAESIIGTMRGEIGALQQQRKALYAQIEQRFPNYANLVNPKPVVLDAVRASLADDEAMISIYVGEQRTYVWAITKQGAPAFASTKLSATDIERIVNKLRKSLDPGSATLGDMPEFDVAEGYKLYQALLKPVESAWRGKNSLLIVPHRALGQIPFSLLPTEAASLKSDKKLLFDGYRNLPWLVRIAAVTQYPSANAFLSLRSLPPADPNRRAFVGFGDPLFNAEQVKEAQQPEPQMQLAAAAPVTRGLHLPLRNLKVARVNTAADVETGLAAAVANTSLLAQVPRLPDTGDEIREIAAALGADAKQDVYLQLRANEDQVRHMDLSNRRIVMFATHGLVPGELNGLNQPALALTAPQLAGVKGDGLLTMEKVLQLKLNADWVVLSACNTAAGDGQGGDAVSGLGRAFFYAGSRALLVTNWPVETTSARALTTELFRRQAADAQLTRAQALRQAMLQLIDGPGYVQGGKSIYSYAHPLFWAPFALVGDGGR